MIKTKQAAPKNHGSSLFCKFKIQTEKRQRFWFDEPKPFLKHSLFPLGFQGAPRVLSGGLIDV